MRTASVTLAGKERLLCFSTRARMALEEHFGSLKEMGEVMTGENVRDKTEAILDAAVILMDAGKRYAEMTEMEPIEPLTKDQLYDVTSAEELQTLHTAVFDAITNGLWRTVGAELPKNSMATPSGPAT